MAWQRISPEILRMQCNEWDRWYVVDVKSECEEDKGIDCNNGDSDNDWKR